MGNWNEFLVGEWGKIDELVNPYTDGDGGQVRVIAFAFVDITVKLPQSFAVVLADILQILP